MLSILSTLQHAAVETYRCLLALGRFGGGFFGRVSSS
jgi:hypothetical protein